LSGGSLKLKLETELLSALHRFKGKEYTIFKEVIYQCYKDIDTLILIP